MSLDRTLSAIHIVAGLLAAVLGAGSIALAGGSLVDGRKAARATRVAGTVPHVAAPPVHGERAAPGLRGPDASGNALAPARVAHLASNLAAARRGGTAPAAAGPT